MPEKLGQDCGYRGYVQRLVETQEYAATITLVDDLEEQDVLEQLLDTVKPPYPEDIQNKHYLLKNYLLKTPFRYPPLAYGSRSGTIQMPGFFYASETIETVLAECAYYRFVVFHDMEEPFKGRVNSEHMSFSVMTNTDKCFDLTTIADDDIQASLQHPSNYQATQTLGRHLVENGTQVIRTYSARLPLGINVAIATIDCIESQEPEKQIRWQFQTDIQQVVMRNETGNIYKFSLSAFLIGGALPKPA